MPGHGNSSPADQPTRQQLDELDELMERMLALPVDHPNEEGGRIDVRPGVSHLAVTPPASLGPAPAFYVTGMVGAPRKPEVSQPVRDPGEKIPGKHDSNRQSPATMGSNPSSTEAGTVFETSNLSASPLFRSRMAYAGWQAAWYLRPIVWSNRVYDAGTWWLGPPGRWLRGNRGRGLLGLAGLLLLIGALAWVAIDGLGWTW